MSNFLHCYYTYMYLQELVQGYTVGKFWFFSYAYALNFINHCFGSLFWLLGVPIGSLFHKKLGPFFKAWGSLLVLGLAMRMHLPMRIGCASMRIDAHHPHIGQKTKSHFLPINCHFGLDSIAVSLFTNIREYSWIMRPQCCLFWLRFSKSLGPEPHQLTNILVILEIFMIYLQSIQSSDTRQTKLKQKKICFYTMPSASQTKGGEKHHRCPMCNYSFNSAALLKIHILVHTGEKPFSCNQCEYKWTQGGTLKIHMRTHSGEKPFTCLQCEFSCTKAGNLKQHMLKHRGEKPFSCNQCNYTCTKATNLKNHMLTHSGEKPFICNECNYKCTVASSLKTHRFIHTGEKPFSCKWCDYTCSQAGDLRRHILTHSGEKPFSCYECNYKCTRASALKRHRDTHTGEKPFDCISAADSTLYISLYL